MNKGKFVKDLAKKCDLSVTKAGDLVSSILEIITKSLAKGEDVVFVGFGTFAVKKRLARVGRNPQTGEKIKIAARKVVRFSTGTALKQAVNKK